MESRNRSNWNIGGRTAALAAVAGLALGASDAFACSLQNWSSNSGGVVANQPDGAAGDPGGDTTSVPRYEALCGMQAANGMASFSQDNRPNGIDRIRARFYVIAQGLPSLTRIYAGYGDESGGSEQFRVVFNPNNGKYILRDTASGIAVSQTGDGGWDSVEIDWDSGGGSLSLSVNGQSPVTAGGLSAGNLESVRLGNLSSASGLSEPLVFDGYEAHRTTEVGRLCNCNANGSADDVVNIQDVITLSNEVGGASLASGTPDCNEDGSVGINDIIQTVNIVGGSGVCVQ